MSIKGLTDRGMAFPEIGQVRKGAPKDERGQLGKDLTYFRVEFDERETEATAKFLKVYGDKPQEINILLPFNEIEKNWDAWLEAYTAGRMVARSDGERYIYLVDTSTGEVIIRDGKPHKAYSAGEVVGTYTDGKGHKQNIICDTVGRLKVVIPELQRLAYMTVMTTSLHDIANISAQLEALKHINGGQIAGIPMVLRRRPKKISTPKADGTRARYTKWMLSIEADPTWVKAKLLDVKHAALPGNGLELLSEPEEESEIEDAVLFESDDEIVDEEEYYQDEIPSQPDMKFEPKPASKSWPEETIKALMEKYPQLNHSNHAVKLLELSKCLTIDTPVETVLGWAHIYRDARDNGHMDTGAAADAADQQVFGG